MGVTYCFKNSNVTKFDLKKHTPEARDLFQARTNIMSSRGHLATLLSRMDLRDTF